MLNDLTSITTLKACLKKAGVAPNRLAGQNFLVCEEVIEATRQVLDSKLELIVELGAGMGTLTQALLAEGYYVKAIERDRNLARALIKNLPRRLQGKLDLVIGDLRKENWLGEEEKQGGRAYQLVGNIPYNLSGLIIRRLGQLSPEPERAVLLVQQEVGERMMAQVPKMNLLSLTVNLWGRADLILQVPADCFWPKPKVNSSLMVLTPRTEQVVDIKEREKVMQVARSFFQNKRKQMAGVLKEKYQLKQREEGVRLLNEASIKEKQRPQEITVEQWRALARVL